MVCVNGLNVRTRSYTDSKMSTASDRPAVAINFVFLLFLKCFWHDEKRQINTKIEIVSMPISHLFLLRRALSTSKLMNFAICSLFLGPIFSKWAALLKHYNDFPCSTKLRCHIDYTQQYTQHNIPCTIGRGRGFGDFQKLNCVSLSP